MSISFMKKVQKARKTAFSLIELSIVLVILSILIVGALSVSTSGITNAKNKVTNDRLQVIYRALGEFMLAQSRLPCPGDITNTKASAGYGVEIGSQGGCSGTGVYISNNQSNIAYGMLPVNALKLPSDMAEDGFGSKFSYVVNKKFTKQEFAGAAASPTGFSYTATNGTDVIKILEEPSANEIDGIIFAVISHGMNKSGAFNATSLAQNAASADTYEQQNYPSSISGSTADYGVISGQGTRVVITATSSSSDVFDDIVLYKTRDNLISDFNAMYLIPCAAQTVNSHTYATAYYGTLQYASSNCATPSTSRPSYRCGVNGTWTLVDSCVAY